MKFPSAGDNNADLDSAKVKQQPEIVQITIEQWILVVPFHFDSDTAFETVDRMRWTIDLVVAHDDGGCELLLDPAFAVQRLIDTLADQ
jgi:hypothetical protein